MADELPTRDQALSHAVRLLHWAEAETDLAKMERVTELADVWAGIAGLQGEHREV
ncbi:hypothetical protein F4561_006574 [Lipingzhangella halophila]|uniref:Uncharacterized protein n=1 Tax=Lipingzhangella halophila TaxID=1783352 RepID=A0A7W7RP95_9ACTN|nr:hypothetical protein [Lipingzhangella halophila]MBB4935665.1 hypothetical protein [Lipingzhangella halophila]